jgi:hypothetical protein
MKANRRALGSLASPLRLQDWSESCPGFQLFGVALYRRDGPDSDIPAGSKCPENWCRLQGSSAQGRAIVSAEISQRQRGTFAVRILEPMGVRDSGSI